MDYFSAIDVNMQVKKKRSGNPHESHYQGQDQGWGNQQQNSGWGN